MKLGDQTIVGFHWPNCDCLLLSELLPGKEKIFLPPPDNKTMSLPAGDVGTRLPV